MADISPGHDLARRLDQRYAQNVDGRGGARQATEATAAESVDAALATQQAQEARATRITDEARKFDAQQRLRDQQLSQDLQNLDQQRQDVVDASRQNNEAAPRGSIIDILA